jgi:cation/acetate symporter
LRQLDQAWQYRRQAEVWIARTSAVLIGLLAAALGILAQGVNVAVLVILAICVAASANFPVLVLSLFWRRFNTGGVIGGMALGLVSAAALALIGPAMRGADALWPLVNPTFVSLPLGFLGGILGTLLAGRDLDNEKRFDAFLFQLHTGVERGEPTPPTTLCAKLSETDILRTRAIAIGADGMRPSRFSYSTNQ